MTSKNRLTDTLKLSVMIEGNKKKHVRALAYLKISEKAYRKFLDFNGKLMRYDIAERKREPWTLTTSKIEIAHTAEGAWSAYRRCVEVYIKLIKSL
jgi:hypothetical protein